MCANVTELQGIFLMVDSGYLNRLIRSLNGCLGSSDDARQSLPHRDSSKKAGIGHSCWWKLPPRFYSFFCLLIVITARFATDSDLDIATQASKSRMTHNCMLTEPLWPRKSLCRANGSLGPNSRGRRDRGAPCRLCIRDEGSRVSPMSTTLSQDYFSPIFWIDPCYQDDDPVLPSLLPHIKLHPLAGLGHDLSCDCEECIQTISCIEKN